MSQRAEVLQRMLWRHTHETLKILGRNFNCRHSNSATTMRHFKTTLLCEKSHLRGMTHSTHLVTQTFSRRAIHWEMPWNGFLCNFSASTVYSLHCCNLAQFARLRLKYNLPLYILLSKKTHNSKIIQDISMLPVCGLS